MADVRKITIEYDLETGKISATYPQDPVLALGMLNRVQSMIFAECGDQPGRVGSNIVSADQTFGPDGIRGPRRA